MKYRQRQRRNAGPSTGPASAPASLRMTSFLWVEENKQAQGQCRSFDCGSYGEAVRASAQDDKSCGCEREQTKADAKGSSKL